MKTLAKIFMIMILGISMLNGAGFEKVAKSRATKVVMSSEKPLSTGSNTLYFQIKEKKLQDSQVRLKIFMPAMPGMPEMKNELNAQSLGNGKFKVTVNLAMSGTWQVHIFITPKTGKKVRVKSSINI